MPPRRWVVERAFSWDTRYRRTVRDCERLPQHHRTVIHVTLDGKVVEGPVLDERSRRRISDVHGWGRFRWSWCRWSQAA
ncbi:MAG: transposase [Pseudonocardiales bacterium]|nr:transposase [Pseudonocardiales bacterium]MBV9030812.1 transposase [Pseudonocardiales bacterium]MBW0011307.1 transposase [Pseudonocardiales bacterium]